MKQALPQIDHRPIRYLVAPFIRFAQLESSSSIVLLLAAVTAFALANSRFAPQYEALLQIPLGASVGTAATSWTLHDFVNDALMAVFFLEVGLEVKRELLVGELASSRHALLPVIAALGGVLTPAIIYSVLNHTGPAEAGWGVPIATDVAFSLAVLALFGRRIPIGLKVFLVTLAIVDDIGGVVVIALAYTSRLHWGYIGISTLIVLFCFALNWLGAMRLPIYLAAGAALWWAVHASGIHSTLSGILLALTVPARGFIPAETFFERGKLRLEAFAKSVKGAGPLTHEAKKHLHSIRSGIELYESPLDRLETALHPWVSFGVVPLFALANADISIRTVRAGSLSGPVFLGILLGLLLGKPAGIMAFSWIAVRFRFADLPHGIGWPQLHAVSWLGGIGFTVSIFIAGLAFHGNEQYTIARVAVLAASIGAAGIGAILLGTCFKRPRAGEV